MPILEFHFNLLSLLIEYEVEILGERLSVNFEPLLKLSSSKIAVTVAPLANAKEVFVDNAPSMFAVPSTLRPSLMFIVELSSALMVVPFNLNPDATTPPVPPGESVISALLGELIVEPTKLKSPTDTDPKDKTPDPFVCKTWLALPSDEGSV